METRVFFALSVFVLLLAMPTALAANGDGYVVSYKPDTASVDEHVTLMIEFTNDAVDVSCLDELIVTPPSDWTGTAALNDYDRGGTTESNEAMTDCKTLQADAQSLRIIPDLPICPGETVNMEIGGLVAPDNYGVDTIKLFTSDQNHNAGPSCIWGQVNGGKSVDVYVTHATKLKLEYFHITDFSTTCAKGDYCFQATGYGAWARLKELGIDASTATPMKIEVETGTTDEVIYDDTPPAGDSFIPMDYSGWLSSHNGASIKDGYLGDQATPRWYYIYYSGNLDLLGVKDEILDDEDLVDSGLAGAQGTLVTAGSAEQRKILVQLTDDDNYDVNEVVPVHIDPDIGSVVETAPYTTDSNGNAFFTFEPECLAGIAEVVISTDPLATEPDVTEYVGIKPNVPDSFEVTEGKDADVPAGESQLIEVKVYDYCGNLVSNTDQALIEFDYLTQNCGDVDKLANVPGGTQNDHHQELTNMGVAQAYLVTGCQLCEHEVKITADRGVNPIFWNLGSENIFLHGIPNVPYKMQVTASDDEITADQCVDALIEVTDQCGNRIETIYDPDTGHAQKWESIVRVTIDEPLVVDQPDFAIERSRNTMTYISSTDMREQKSYDSWVQGKLNDGAANVEICGCMGIGTFDIVAESDTILDGNDTVSVINAAPDCIEVETADQLLQCENQANLDIAVKDYCGNYWTNQDCQGGPATYCVDIELSGSCGESDAHLSTNTVCVDVGRGGLGYADPGVTIYRDTDECCQLDIDVSNGEDCCEDFPELPKCGDASLLFHGAPSFMTTQFYKTRQDCSHPILVKGLDGFDHEFCIEQLHEQIDMRDARETVSEEVLDLFTVYDECGHAVKDFNGTIDVEIDNEDCMSHYQVDHPVTIEGGYCTGHVDCSELTIFGQDKCEETPYFIEGESLDYCAWTSVENEGTCEGTPDCSSIIYEGQCGNWGCIWDDDTDTCSGDPDYECDDPTAPGAGHNEEICPEVGCTWVPDYSCKGEVTSNMPNNCRAYTADEDGKEQCMEVGASQESERGCEWTNDCDFDKEIIKKLVIDNCAPETEKQWLPLEKDDIMVDKLAFNVSYDQDPPGLWLYVFVENEHEPGFQAGQDDLVGKAPVVYDGPTIIELEDSWNWEWDDQREGGVLIRAGDTRDFYVMLVNKGQGKVACGTYSADFLWYQDYTAMDITEFGAGWPDPNGDGVIEVNPLGGFVEDFCKDSDNYNFIDWPYTPYEICGPGYKDSRNDDYRHTTPDYGFGDTRLYELQFADGQAWMKFRDLTAETVTVTVKDVDESGLVCDYTDKELDDAVCNNAEPGTGLCEGNEQEVVTFESQPATQIELINHDEWEHKTVSCDENWDEDVNAYLFNIQTTDGFENPHGKEIEVELEYCLKIPVSKDAEDVIHHFCHRNWQDLDFESEEVCRLKYKDIDHCYTKEELKEFIKDTDFGEYMGEVLFGDYFGPEFNAWIDKYFEDAKVEFWDTNHDSLPYDAHGHQVVMTDGNGQAQVFVTADKSGGYKIIARPLALDAASAFVWFNAGPASQLDLMALPSFGVPADGEEEALLLLRAFDSCGNLVDEPVHDITVEVIDGDQVYISQDFEGKNNYDDSVTGTLWYNWFLGLTKLAVLSDLPQTATLLASSGEMDSDTTTVTFQGAPVQLNISSIMPSDRIPADGKTGAWVTVQVQDKNFNRVTGYLGDGFSGDPGDPWGNTDFKFDNICIELDDTDAKIPLWFLQLPDIEKQTFGWVNFHEVGGFGSQKYCGDLLFGEGMVYVTYGNPDYNHGGTVNLNVYDKEPYQGQEFDENGLPKSNKATQLDPARGHVDFVDPATQWSASSDKVIALADGKTKVLIKVQVENPYMDVRQPVEGVAYVGGDAQEGAVLSWNGMVDPHNPTSARFVTDPKTGSTYIELTSTTPGIAEVTITGGDAYACLGVDDVTLSACISTCNDGLQFDGGCLDLCLSGDIGVYTCPTCEEVVPKFWCHYSSKEDLTPTTIEVEFLEVADNEVYLNTGWNFISTPYALVDPDAEDVFNGLDVQAAYGWDANAQSWDLLVPGDDIEPLEGYWVKMNSPGVLAFEYDSPAFPTIPTKSVQPGWNAVGLTWDSPMSAMNALISISDSYSQLIGWIASLQSYDLPVANTGGMGPLETGGYGMQPKQGYWIWVTDADNLAGLTALSG